MGVSTNAKRNYDDDSGGSGKNKKKRWNESKDRQMPLIKHTRTSGGFPKDDKHEHNSCCAIIPESLIASGEARLCASADIIPESLIASGEARLRAFADINPVVSTKTGEAGTSARAANQWSHKGDAMLDKLLARIKVAPRKGPRATPQLHPLPMISRSG